MAGSEQMDSQAIIDRLPPQNPEAEEAVLGSILMDPEAVGKVVADLKVADFYRQRNGVIYAAATRLFQAGKAVDFLTISDELKRDGRYEEIGGLGYLSQLIGVVPTAVHIEHYAGIVRRTALKRRLISAAGKIAGLAYDDSLELEEVMSRAQKLLTDVAMGRARNRIATPAELADLLLTMGLKIAEDKRAGLLSWFHGLDRLTNGFREKELITVLGDTSIGKSAWALSLSRNVAKARDGGPVLYCSIEMSKEQLVARLAAGVLQVNWKEFERELMSGENLEQNSTALEQAAELIRELPIYVYYEPSMTLLDIRTKALEMRALGELAMVVVDYAQLITPAGRSENRVVEMSEISRGLKRIAGEASVPLVALCQISREAVKGRENKRPGLHDARESGSWEQDSDILLGVYRDDAYYDVGARNDKKELVVAGNAQLLVLKNRSGDRNAIVPMTWRSSTAEYLSGTGTEVPW